MKMFKSIKQAGLTIVSLISIFCPISTVASGLESQLDTIFDGMANVTAPGVYESQRRGVLAGGRISARAKTMEENFVNIQMPSAKAGCGGIDMFGGSFSFINADQLVQLLRSVAANAKGYAFKLAMDNMCPQCAATISEFQEKVQKLNGLMANSCQLAQGIVNGGAAAIDNQFQTDIKRNGVNLGTFADEFEGAFSFGQDNTKVATDTLTEEQKAKFYGNITWKSLRKNNVATWAAGGDDDLLYAMLALTGGVIIPEPQDDAEIENSSAIKPIYLPQLVTLKDLVLGSQNGNQIEVYDCSADEAMCMSPAKRQANISGFRKRIVDFLLAPDTGIIDRIRDPNNGTLSQAQQSFMISLPQSMGTMISRIAIADGGTQAEAFVEKITDTLAVHMAYQFSMEVIDGSIKAVQTSTSPWVDKSLDQARSNKESLRQEYLTMKSEVGDMVEAMDHYDRVLKNAQRVELEIRRNIPGGR